MTLLHTAQNSSQADAAIEDCPFCASDWLEVVQIDDDPRAHAVRCNECGAMGPCSLSDDPAHAVFAWNQRMGRISLVKG